MTTNPFIVTIGKEKVPAYQNAKTGLFYTVAADGKHTPIESSLIMKQTTEPQRLKYWRNRHGYTQTDLAELIHVSSPTVIMTWENGLRRPLKKYRRLLNAELGSDIFQD